MPLPNCASPPNRILLVRFSHLGDVVCALPLYHALRSAYPGARIAWATQTEFAPLLEPLPGLERVLCLDRRGGLGGIKRLRQSMRAFKPDLSVDAQGNYKSAIAALLSGAPRRIGPHPRDWREASARHLITDHAAPATGPHACDRVSAITRLLTGGDSPRFDPAVSASELHAAERALELHMPGQDPFLLVHISRPGDPRSWPEVRYQELAEEAAGRGLQTLFLSGPGEADLGHRLAGSTTGVRHWVGQRGLRELAAIFNAAARRGAHLLVCDSGPMHLAAACGLGVTLLAGPQDPRATGPEAWGHGHSVLRAQLLPACAPCKLRECHHPRGAICMKDITASQALDAVSSHPEGAPLCA